MSPTDLLFATFVFLATLAVVFDKRSTKKEAESLLVCQDVRNGAQALADQAHKLKRRKQA